ncbi:MAG: adenylate/guanylate cyclase domain-containing protein [Chthoniobacterales bacterium]|nr:adenylate/guanylate cyclase domain-containing protein [Chthoniobacterales bacterium]
MSLRGRGWMWAISAGFCPIGSLLLLSFAPSNAGSDPRWLAVFVAAVGIAFGLCSAALISRLVAHPIDELRTATQAVAQGQLDISLSPRRADEFGALFGEFNNMISELREKERLCRVFGAHVRQEAAKQILARGFGVGGSEQVVTIMFLDIRGFTSRSAKTDPAHAVALLNEFLGLMVEVVETQHGGMVNKFLGDGFMAIFGAGSVDPRHADDALAAARTMQRQLDALNVQLAQRGEAPIELGIGINTGAAIVGSIGSPERLEFTVIGSAVNLASRIQALTKTIGKPLLVTETTAESLVVRDGLHDCGPQEVRGVDQPVRVFAG